MCNWTCKQMFLCKRRHLLVPHAWTTVQRTVRPQFTHSCLLCPSPGLGCSIACELLCVSVSASWLECLRKAELSPLRNGHSGTCRANREPCHALRATLARQMQGQAIVDPQATRKPFAGLWEVSPTQIPSLTLLASFLEVETHSRRENAARSHTHGLKHPCLMVEET